MKKNSVGGGARVPVSIAQGCRSSGRGVVISRSGWIAAMESRAGRCLDTGSQCQVLLIEPAQHASVPCTLMFELNSICFSDILLPIHDVFSGNFHIPINYPPPIYKDTKNFDKRTAIQVRKILQHADDNEQLMIK